MTQRTGAGRKRGNGLAIGCAVVLVGGLVIVGAGFAFERAKGREVMAFCDGVRAGEPVAEVASRVASSGLHTGPISASAGMLIIINSFSFTRCLVDHDGERVIGHKLFFSG